MMKQTGITLPFQAADPARKNFQFLEDMAAAYWYSEVLFTALDLALFDWIERGAGRIEDLAAACRRVNDFLVERFRSLLETVRAAAVLTDVEDVRSEIVRNLKDVVRG